MIERDSFINSLGSDEQTYLGLKTALTMADERNFVVVFSDEPGNVTDLALKEEVIALTKSTKSKVFFLMRPHARQNGPKSPEEALQEMKDNFDEIGTVIDIENHNLQETLNQIIDELNNSDICESDDDGETTTVTSETTTPEPLPETCIIKVCKVVVTFDRASTCSVKFVMYRLHCADFSAKYNIYGELCRILPT